MQTGVPVYFVSRVFCTRGQDTTWYLVPHPGLFCPWVQNTVAKVAAVSCPRSCFGFFFFFFFLFVCLFVYANFSVLLQVFSSFNRIENLYFVIVLFLKLNNLHSSLKYTLKCC